MCVSVPMQVIEIKKNSEGVLRGRACYEGIVKDISLAARPDVRVGDYVMVQFGLATVRVDPDEARELLGFLRQLDQMMLEATGDQNPEQSTAT